MEQTVVFSDWLSLVTEGSISVVELGARLFDKLYLVNSTVKERIGIEIFQAHVDDVKYTDCVKIVGNALNYRELLSEYSPDTCMLIDVLEHFERDAALDLITKLKEDFEKIVLFIPCGKYEQNRDVTGYGAHEEQTHRSSWYDEDIMELGFHSNIKDPFFHKGSPMVATGEDTACYFCTWEKKYAT